MERFPINAETMNALIDAQSALALALALTMTPKDRDKFANCLSRLAANAESKGATTLETMLIDLHTVVRR